jgi:hypothetical protein
MGLQFQNLRDLFEGKHAKTLGFGMLLKPMIYKVGSWLEENGFHGLRCEERGEVTPGLTDWSSAMTYAIFNNKISSELSEERL